MKAYKPTFMLKTDHSARADVLKISGDLAWDTVCLMNETLLDLMASNSRLLAIDLSELEFIDSKGVGLLVRMKRFFSSKNINVVLVAVPWNVRKVLDLTFTLSLFSVYSSVAEAESRVFEAKKCV